MDFSCYVTVMNRSTRTLTCTDYTNPDGDYTTVPQSNIASSNQAYFVLNGGIDSDGSSGTVSFQVGDGGSLTFSFQCPLEEDNNISVPVITSGDVTVNYYGTNEIIDWDPNGSNWGPPENYPAEGHPLSVLFVVSPKSSRNEPGDASRTETEQVARDDQDGAIAIRRGIHKLPVGCREDPSSRLIGGQGHGDNPGVREREENRRRPGPYRHEGAQGDHRNLGR